jgi:hypothetical protein
LYFIFSFIVLFLVVALRDRVGRDYTAYANAYIRINSGYIDEATKEWLGIGYRALCRIVGFFGEENYRLMFAIIGFLTLYFFYEAILNISKQASISLFLLISFCLYYQMFNQSRQMLAISITTYAYKYLIQEEVKSIHLFLILVFLAMLFHTSALIMLILLFVHNRKVNIRLITAYALLTATAFSMYNILVYLISFTNYGRTYFGWAVHDTSFELSSTLNLAIRLFMLAFCLLFSKNVIKRAPYTKGLYNAVLICTCFQVITLRSHLFGRITTYCFIFYIFLIPEVLATICLKTTRYNKIFIYGATIILFSAYHLVYYFSSNGAIAGGYNLYRTFVLGN